MWQCNATVWSRNPTRTTVGESWRRLRNFSLVLRLTRIHSSNWKLLKFGSRFDLRFLSIDCKLAIVENCWRNLKNVRPTLISQLLSAVVYSKSSRLRLRNFMNHSFRSSTRPSVFQVCCLVEMTVISTGKVATENIKQTLIAPQKIYLCAMSYLY